MDPLKGKITPFQRLWHQWKSLRNVPFRKKWFVGYDLDANTYWEFSNANNPVGRLRRIVEYHEKGKNFTDYKIPPRWIQWLRHTRYDYPSLQTLIAEEQRQEAMKILASRADERWKQESVLEENKRILNERVRSANQAIGRSPDEQFEQNTNERQQNLLRVEEESPIESANIQPRR
ncbi:hypothetical protein BN7_5885 [Wickerhamomyces ciferrii]|uniref:Uncharacterized protein n=1 Tax=Wickerhamomyces ciferrii (strain ATCC 14091 / BCRC 22168 / CBS 111 / JCM 3599 / NBRC 0793 / NRRL Y-1031 F-60-10) TaxID=1206466 RepID=K0KYZ1_WICCF|nr:uncharacterized protein BN7_5885 [Wickerhamomyces ciferrii]CCH46293.1 hypothetical protein BN7_5885 [Wickerhamomyces ciferrii]